MVLVVTALPMVVRAVVTLLLLLLVVGLGFDEPVDGLGEVPVLVLVLPVLPDHALPVVRMPPPLVLRLVLGARRLMISRPAFDRPGPVTAGGSIGTATASGQAEDTLGTCCCAHLLQVTLSLYSPDAPA